MSREMSEHVIIGVIISTGWLLGIGRLSSKRYVEGDVRTSHYCCQHWYKVVLDVGVCDSRRYVVIYVDICYYWCDHQHRAVTRYRKVEFEEVR
jgi:hypothetical protein